MTLSAHFVLMLLACICLFLAAIGRPAACPIALGWLGLFFWALDLLIRGS